MLICYNVNKRYNQVFFNLDALAPDFIESINIYVLYSDLFERSADYRRQIRSIFVHQRTEAKDHKQYIWIIM